MNKDWTITIPNKEELDNFFFNEDTDELELASNGDWKITLYISAEADESGNLKNITGCVEIHNEHLYNDKTIAKYGENLCEKIHEFFCHNCGYLPIDELRWKLPSLVEECINYINYIKDIVKDLIYAAKED